MAKNIVAICGPRGCGKTTLAKLLSEKEKYVITSFARPIKKMLMELVTQQGCTYEIATRMLYHDLKNETSDYLGGKTPVYAMQTLGTEWGRNLINVDLWSNVWKRRVLNIINNGYSVVVDDLRFLSEEKVLRTLDNVIVVRVMRHGYDVEEHQSEAEFPHITPDIRIYNNDFTPEIMLNTLLDYMGDVNGD